METVNVAPGPHEEIDDEDLSDEDDNDSAIDDFTNKVLLNPYQYDLHIQLISLLRKEGEFVKLRKAREKMSEVFPLTGVLWMDWIQDEMKFIEGDDSREEIEKLFNRAVEDYLALNVWLEFAQFSLSGIASPGGVEKARSICERAITAGGLHVAKGNSIWEVYREFENALLMTMQPPPGSIASEEKEREIKVQTERIHNIFKRQLRVPLLDMDETLAEYEEWLGEEAEEEVMINYKTALAKLKKYEPYEESLVDSEGSTLAQWQTYLEFIQKEGDPATVRCCFERAVEEHCLATDLWLDYTQYLDSTSNIGHLLITVYQRAVRNCPWSPTLWKGFMHSLEKYEQPHETVKETFEKSLLGGFAEPSDFLGLWETYIDYLRRRLDGVKNSETETTQAKEELRVTIEKGAEYLSHYFGSTADPSFRLQQFQALVEAKYFQNMEKSRELWNSILSAGHSSKAHMWMEYYQLERVYGDSKHCRKILHRAVNAVSDSPEQVCEALLMFERLEGSLDTLQSATRRVDTQMKKVEERREKAREYEESSDGWERQWERRGRRRPAFKQGRGKDQGWGKDQGRGKGQGWGKEQGKGKDQYQKYFVKGESGSSKGHDGMTQKKKEMEKDDLRHDRWRTQDERQDTSIPGEGMKGVKRKADSSQAFDEDQSKRMKQYDEGVFKVPMASPLKVPKPTKSTVMPPPGMPVANSGGQQVDEGFKAEPMDTDTNTIEHKMEEGLNPETGSQDKTIFVKNLGYDVGEEKLKEVFAKCGAIKEVRLVTNYQKKSRGFGYVEFETSDSVAKALALDRETVEGRPMYVDKYVGKEKQKPAGKDFKYEMKMEKNKLFVSNLPRSATKEELEKLFGQYGDLKEVRVVTYRSGVPKGLAYVEYQNEADASKAIISTDGTNVGGHNICVAISNPPSRKQPFKERKENEKEEEEEAKPASNYPKSLGAKGVSGPRGKGRTQLSMMPRSLQRQSNTAPQQKDKAETTDGEPQQQASSEGDKPKKMSNADFAKMFLKK